MVLCTYAVDDDSENAFYKEKTKSNFSKVVLQMKRTNKKGFTLAELLIVVAIIAVLVAIAIPIFTAQLEKSRESTDMANIRSAYAEIIANYIQDSKAATAEVELKSDCTNWKSDDNAKIANVVAKDILGAGAADKAIVSITADGACTVKVGSVEKSLDTSFVKTNS